MTDDADFTEALISRSPVIVRRRVLWGECDPAAVVYTPRFADYVISARDWFMRIGLGVLDRPHPLKSGPVFPMRAMTLDFASTLAADDLFDMKVELDSVSRRTFTIEVIGQRLTGNRSFSARLTSVCVDSATRDAIAIPDLMQDALKKYQQAPGHRRVNGA